MREINLNGYIDDEVWFGDEITPDSLHEKLYEPGTDSSEEVHIRLNSYGGSCNAAVRMHDDLAAYPGKVSITISGTAASAATVLAMAADTLEMTPGSLFMIHDPIVGAIGNESDLMEAIGLLRACKDSIINVYATRTMAGRDQIAQMMKDTTWMDAEAALAYGFIDCIAASSTFGTVINCAKILEMRQKRAELWDQAKAFLDEHTGENGVMSAEDTEVYERMEQDVVNMGRAIERLERAEQMDREMNDPVSPALAGKPERQSAPDGKRGTASDAYNRAFWNSVRGRVNYDVRNALQVGELTEGGYTVPDSFEHQLIEALQEENIMRGLVHVITTDSGDRKIPLVTNYGTASWIEEEAQIPESDVAFNQITLGAHKLATAIRISQELLNDSAFDLAGFIAHEFQRRAGAAEEEAILAGDGSHKPIGLLHATLGAQVGVTTASATAITADELIDLQHSLKSGYRRKASFIMNDATIKAIRKLKDGNGQFIWQPSIREGVPDMILNTKVYMSNYMPLVEAGNKVILYGDYSYYWLADRAGRTLQRLNELYAMTDQIGFKLTERLDGRLILPEAVKVLKMKAA